MKRLLSGAARAGVALAILLLVLGVARWGPIHAEPPVDVRALPCAGAAVLLAVVARPDRCFETRAARVAGGGCARGDLAALALVIALRPPSGLRLEVSDPGSSAVLPDAGLDVSGRGLRDLVEPRRARLRWQGQLRAPRDRRATCSPGVAAGPCSVLIDGRDVLDGRRRVAAGRGAARPRRRPSRHRGRARGAGPRPAPAARLDPARAPRPVARRRGAAPLPRARGLALVDRSPTFWRSPSLRSAALLRLARALGRPRASFRLPEPVTRRQVAVSALGYAVLLAAMSWPLVLDPVHQGMTDRPDGRLNAWILAWDVHALSHEPGRLFQAPIFHPLPDALAFSENLLLPALLSAPALWAGGPVLAYNFVLLLSLLVSGLGVELLVRRGSGDRLAAFVAGAVFAAGAHRWIRLAHLHAEVTLFLPFALLALDRFFERRTLRSRAARRPSAGPPGAVLRLPGRDHRHGPGGRGRGRRLRRLRARAISRSSARAFALAGLLVLPGGRALFPDARLPGGRVHPRHRGRVRDHPRVLRRERHPRVRRRHRSAISTPSACRTRCSPAS